MGPWSWLMSCIATPSVWLGSVVRRQIRQVEHEVYGQMKTVEFWFEFASTYSYLSAMRIEQAADAKTVKIEWKPFLLGPIFHSCGWHTSPFEIYPQKGIYMWRDMARRAAKYGLPFHALRKEKGHVFPQNSVSAARLAILGLELGWGTDFCRSVYHAEFVLNRDIADQELLFDLARQAGASEDHIKAAFGDENKSKLRKQTDKAMEHGIFGAPSFIAQGELFWGDDRLDDAIECAASE